MAKIEGIRIANYRDRFLRATDVRRHAEGLCLPHHAGGFGAAAVHLHRGAGEPYFVDALKPDETWILEKQADGFAKVSRASDDEIVRSMVTEGLPLGGLWYSDYLDRK